MQCDQMVRLFFNIRPFEMIKLAQQCNNFAKVGSTFYQIRNKLPKICQRLVKCYQSGEILPNLVTLVACMSARSNIFQGQHFLFDPPYLRAKKCCAKFANFSLCKDFELPTYLRPRDEGKLDEIVICALAVIKRLCYLFIALIIQLFIVSLSHTHTHISLLLTLSISKSG